MSWESFEEFSQPASDQPEGFDASRGPSLGGGHPGVQDMTPAQQAQHVASIAAEQAAQAAQVQDLVDQLSSIGYDVGARFSAPAAVDSMYNPLYGGTGYRTGSWAAAQPPIDLPSDYFGAQGTSIYSPRDRPNDYTGWNDQYYGRPSDWSELANITGLDKGYTPAQEPYDPSLFDPSYTREDAEKKTDAILEFIDGKTSIDGRKFEKSDLTPNEAYVAMLNQIGHTPVNQLGTGDPLYSAGPDFGVTSPPAEHPPEYLRDEWDTYHPGGPPSKATSIGEGIYSMLSGIPGITTGMQWGGRIFGGEEFADRERNTIHAIDDFLGTTPFNIDPLDPSLGSSKRSDLGSDIPAQMPGGLSGLFSGLTYGPPNPGEPSENPDAGNIEAIYRFLQDPNYGNMPAIDPISAMAAYENAIRGIDAVVDERGFTDRGFAQAARDRSQGIFDKFEAGQDFDSMLNEKIGRAFADEALFNKDIELRGQGLQAINQAFPQGFETDIFNPDAFSKVAENIYGQKLSGAQDVIARAGARGQLSPRGGRLASESLLSQGPDVQSRLDDILGGVRSEAEGGLDTIRGSALEAAQGYKLGDELFDVTPFTDQARDYLTTTVGELPGRVSEAVGSDPLFSAVSALQEGGRQQGMVSGTPSFLDVLAEREGTPGTGRDKRGLGSRGSGVF